MLSTAFPYILLMEAYRYSYVSGAKPVTVTISWSGSYVSGGTPGRYPPFQYSYQVQPTPGSHTATKSVNAYDMRSVSGSSVAQYALSWTDDAGPHTATSPAFYWMH